jgi:hypothetical protein
MIIIINDNLSFRYVSQYIASLDDRFIEIHCFKYNPPSLVCPKTIFVRLSFYAATATVPDDNNNNNNNNDYYVYWTVIDFILFYLFVVSRTKTAFLFVIVRDHPAIFMLVRNLRASTVDIVVRKFFYFFFFIPSHIFNFHAFRHRERDYKIIIILYTYTRIGCTTRVHVYIIDIIFRYIFGSRRIAKFCRHQYYYCHHYQVQRPSSPTKRSGAVRNKILRGFPLDTEVKPAH